MASAQNFRSAFNGFNREDVVHYIEYLNAKHTGALNQLTVTNAKFDETVGQTLEQMHQKTIAALENKREEARKKVGDLADDNLIITPLLGAVEILFGHCIAWYQAMKKSVSGFMEYAEKLVENGRRKAEEAVDAAAHSAAQALPEARFSVESNLNVHRKDNS